MEIVKSFEIKLLDPETRKSPEILDRLLSDDFIEFAQSGNILNKRDILNLLPTTPVEKISMRDYDEKMLSPDIIFVRYVADRTILVNGETKHTLCSSIWQRKEKRWQMVFFQGTPAKV